MELLKAEAPLEMPYKDAVFLIKKRATAYDKFLLAMSGKVEGNTTKFAPSDFYRVLAQQFVVGWRGVTREGEKISYSWAALESAFPSDPEDDVFLRLGTFILENTDVFKTDISLKKDSRRQLIGSAESEPSIAAGKTVGSSQE